MTHKKHIYISHGDKGGVGKSVLSAAVAEALLRESGKLALVEGDATQPDVALRYEQDPGVIVGILPLNRAGDANPAVSAFAKWLEESDPQAVVINLPAGASDTLDEHGGLIRELADALGYNLVCYYSLGKGDTPTAGLVKSLKSGLMSHIDPARQIVVYPEFQGKPDTFVWHAHPARQSFGGREIIMPALPNPAAFRLMLGTPGRIADLATRGAQGWMVVDRLNVGRWLKITLDAIQPTLHVED